MTSTKLQKIFLCSTAFDLEDIRALIVDRFSGKYEFIHFEDAAFPSRRGLHSHDQCLEAVKYADIVICLVDKRYGGIYAGDRKEILKGKVEKLGVDELSITWCELITAFDSGRYVITFARKKTMDEKETKRKNKDLAGFTPAHVDNIHVFDLLDWITKQRKDNWIIPFDNAVDLLKKLEKWLMVASEQLLPTESLAGNSLRTITVVVEGSTDATIVRAIIGMLDLRVSVSIVVAGGKRLLFGSFRNYLDRFNESAGIIFLADADTVDSKEVRMQEEEFKKIIATSPNQNAKLILIRPEIEVWLNRTKFRRDSILNYNKLFEELHFLQKELDARAKRIPSLADFIATLRSFSKS